MIIFILQEIVYEVLIVLIYYLGVMGQSFDAELGRGD